MSFVLGRGACVLRRARSLLLSRPQRLAWSWRPCWDMLFLQTGAGGCSEWSLRKCSPYTSGLEDVHLCGTLLHQAESLLSVTSLLSLLFPLLHSVSPLIHFRRIGLSPAVLYWFTLLLWNFLSYQWNFKNEGRLMCSVSLPSWKLRFALTYRSMFSV